VSAGGGDFGPKMQRFIAGAVIVVGAIIFLASGACTINLLASGDSYGQAFAVFGAAPILLGLGLLIGGILKWRADSKATNDPGSSREPKS
jgi:hypothetical protein